MTGRNRIDSLDALLKTLKPKTKEPNNKRVLDSWINQIENALPNERGGRLSWLVASTVVTAALQKSVDLEGNSRFLLKGGTLLQHRLGAIARATKDLDGLVRGDIDSYLEALDEVLAGQWGPLTLVRGEIETINTPAKVIKPRAFIISITLKGDTWRKVKVEISPDEGGAGSEQEATVPPNLAGLGLPTPDALATLAMRYQIAQKVHSSTDPHKPPEYVNERPRDVIDLILIRELVQKSGTPSNSEILSAIKDIFAARADEAKLLERLERMWPAKVTALPHWEVDYKDAAEKAGINLSLAEAIDNVNEWLDEISAANRHFYECH